MNKKRKRTQKRLNAKLAKLPSAERIIGACRMTVLSNLLEK